MTNPPDRKATKALLRYLRAWQWLSVDVCGGVPWWTNRYIAMPANPTMLALLASYNLDPLPMTCDVGRTIVKTSNIGSPIAGVLPADPSSWKPIAPLLFGGAPLMTEIGSGARAEVWSVDGSALSHTLDAAHLAALRTGSGLGELTLLTNPAKPLGPVIRVSGSGAVVGLIMPVRMHRSDAYALACAPEPAAVQS